MSRFGIIEMTRQRVRRNIEHTHNQTCPTCKGTGRIRNPETTTAEVLRRIRDRVLNGKFNRIVVKLHPEVLVHFQNEMRREIVEIEESWGGRIVLEHGKGAIDSVELKCYK